jgi:Bacterial Ig-like domain (group 3)/Domain of unknown function (DUF4214)
VQVIIKNRAFLALVTIFLCLSIAERRYGSGLLNPAIPTDYNPPFDFATAKAHQHGGLLMFDGTFLNRELIGPGSACDGFYGNTLVFRQGSTKVTVWYNFCADPAGSAALIAKLPASAVNGNLVRVTYDPVCGLATSVQILDITPTPTPTPAKANQTITFGALANKTFGDADFNVSATASSGLTVSFAATGNCSIAGNTVHLTGLGSCTITASQAGNANFNAAPDVPQSFTIAKTNQTITFGALANKTFGNADFNVSATASSGLPVSVVATGNCTVSGNTVHLTGPGSCTITASQAGNANYNAAPDVPQSFTIAKAATTTSLTSLLNPSALAQSVTFTATVNPAPNTTTPTGTVQFKDGGINLGAAVSLNASGVAQLTPSTLTAGTHAITADYSGNTNFNPSTGALSQVVNNRALLKFSQSSYHVSEDGKFITITVNRSGDAASAVTVEFASPDDSVATIYLPCSSIGAIATPRCDFTTAVGTLRFASGESSKTFDVLISQDSYLEGPETFPLTLSHPTGGAGFAQPGDALSVVTIDDDAAGIVGELAFTESNPIDDNQNFVRQHYHDFLNREPDAPGLNFWTSQITNCGANQTCIDAAKISVSASFFLSIEFQQTGYYVERTYKTGFGDIAPPTIPVPVRFIDFLRDTQEVERGVIVGQGQWQAQLDANKRAFALALVQRPDFLTRYPANTSPLTFVSSLNTNAGSVLTGPEQTALIALLAPNPADATLRSNVLFQIAENQKLQQQESSRAFVLMEYFGYLRRNPDAAPDSNFAGFNFWLTKLNQFSGNYINAEMVKAFITAVEYRQRFGP